MRESSKAREDSRMQLDPAQASPLEVYQYLVGIVTPRPIAWVTTLSAQGVVNLAPFSFFNLFGANPPIVVFSPTLRRDGSKKDTLRNLEHLGECVIHAATASLAEKVNLSSKEVPPEESEVALTGLTTVASVKVRPPRLVESPTALECVVRQILSFGRGPIAPNLVIAEVVMIHVAEGVLLEGGGGVDPRRLQTVARLGGNFWCRTTDLFELPRP
ncbi:MAG: flavin reductase family protein [Gemmataceae bacterium]|nr:flavin reductase family protein [Gemmataceae bacterium]MCS7270440.1 flavin reductase family protein [Gemmataceae bacterium]MDW8242772.1 flavin reductase family protein [Thermogemmata sp.]